MQEADVWDGRELSRLGSWAFAEHKGPLGPFRFVVMGPPGSGTRTQAAILGERLGASLLSAEETRNLARLCGSAEVKGRLQEINETSPNPDRSGSVHRDCGRGDSDLWFQSDAGFTIEGFPRSAEQAEALMRLLSRAHIDLTAVLYYDLALEWAVARLASRSRCRKCGAESSPGQWPQRQTATCAKCGGDLRPAGRDDPRKVRERFVRYEHEVQPVLDYFGQLGLLLTIEAEGCPEEVFQRTEFKLMNVLPAMT
jgi:adenylate kinase